jgi:hypothetical protein
MEYMNCMNLVMVRWKFEKICRIPILLLLRENMYVFCK